MSKQDFEQWLEKQDGFSLPMCAWGPEQTTIAVRFATDMAAAAVRRALDEALNSGDGSYRP